MAAVQTTGVVQGHLQVATRPAARGGQNFESCVIKLNTTNGDRWHRTLHTSLIGSWGTVPYSESTEGQSHMKQGNIKGTGKTEEGRGLLNSKRKQSKTREHNR